jgi:hypothetical protein
LKPSAAAAALLALAIPVPAHAKLFDIYAGPRVGMVQGWGQGRLRGLGFGAEAGAELLLFDVMVDYTALVGGQRSGASLTELMLGLDGDLPLDEAAGFYLRLGTAAGLGLLTPKAPVAAGERELSYKGLVVRGTLALERHLNRFVVVGLEFTGGYHYFLESGLIKQLTSGMPVVPPDGTTPALADRWVHGGQFAGLITIRAHFEPLR